MEYVLFLTSGITDFLGFIRSNWWLRSEPPLPALIGWADCPLHLSSSQLPRPLQDFQIDVPSGGSADETFHKTARPGETETRHETFRLSKRRVAHVSLCWKLEELHPFKTKCLNSFWADLTNLCFFCQSDEDVLKFANMDSRLDNLPHLHHSAEYLKSLQVCFICY